MKLFLLLSLPPAIRALSFNAYDLGFYGIYPTEDYISLGWPTPRIQFDEWSSRCDSNDDLILITPRGVHVPNPGPVILDARGNLIWSEDRYGQAMNLQVQKYKGQDYLTFWSGKSHGPHSNGTYYMLDSSYEPAYTITALGIEGGDLHEFEVTEDGTALVTMYQDKEVDCRNLGFENTCWINDCIFQEIDIETGKLLFQWTASDHVPLSDSYKARGNDAHTKETSYDFFHLNSVEKDILGNYLISSRHMHTIYYLDRTGEILWAMGGRHSDFTDLSEGRATDFKWQHHARWHENYTMISLFDNNGNNVFHSREEYSRGMVISVDLKNMTAALVHEYVHPDRILAISQGSMQLIESSGHVLVGWGNTPSYTEFAENGEVLCSMHFGALLFSEILDLGWVKSYRTFKHSWIGYPKPPPDIAVSDGHVYVSWNGATEIAGWRLQSAGSFDNTSDKFVDEQDVTKIGFETVFLCDGLDGEIVRAAAIGGNGTTLGYTKAVRCTSSRLISFWQIVVFALTVVIIATLVWRFSGPLSEYDVKNLRALRNCLAPRTKKGTHNYELIQSRA